MSRNNVVPLRNRVKAKLALSGLTVAAWARSRGHHPSEVWMNMSGQRCSQEIRKDLAAVLGTTVAKLNAEIAEIAAQRTQGAA